MENPPLFLFTTVLSIKIKLLTDAFKFQKYGVICIRKKKVSFYNIIVHIHGKFMFFFETLFFFKKIAYCSSGNNALTHHLNCFAKIH